MSSTYTGKNIHETLSSPKKVTINKLRETSFFKCIYIQIEI